jgi:2-polyprenyl-3-methyl-5-hydroxy-6-metoxy-1,4-benzoquinol methylase
MKDKKTLSREIGLEIGMICGKHFLNVEHLHYGYWTKDLKVELASLPAAQKNYTDFLMSNIPDGVKSILDVGCGMGHTAKRLTEAGYTVDCVSPSSFLAQQARALLQGKSEIFECFYEQLQTDKRYDLVLFSESFQYIDPETAIQKTLSLVTPGGQMLICDVFKRDVQEKSPISGGHHLSTFFAAAAKHSLSLVKDLDITEETAPSRDLENRICKDVLEPVSNLIEKLVDSRYPTLSTCLKWVYRKKLAKMRHKYFGGQRTAEVFKKFKTYRLFLYKTNPAA